MANTRPVQHDETGKNKVQRLENQYAALVRSKYDFGAGTAKTTPSPERLTEIEVELLSLKAQITEALFECL